MVSSMGNAFTFPLQTLLFSSLVYGVYRALGIPFERPYRQSLGNFAVFGDDIIIVRKAYNLVSRMLSLCGFSVNVNKSFNEGFFRESCGGDFWCGHNVRGVYIESLKRLSDVYSAINRLNVWSAKWGVALPRTIQFLMKGVRLLPIPFHEMDTGGIKVPLRSLRKIIRNEDTGGVFYRYLHIKAKDYAVTDVGTRPLGLRGWVYNPSAILLAALAGKLRSGKLAVRVSRQATCFRSRYSSSWDYIYGEWGVSSIFDDRWKSFVELNLNLS